MSVFGKVEEFNGSKEDWPQYVERLGHFFAANDITEDDKKKEIFLAVVGPAMFNILRNLLAPKKPGDHTYKENVEVLAKHFKPSPSEIVERFKFHSRFRKQEESVSTFVAELCSLSKYCNFGDTLEVMIRDRLVCGINDDGIQRRLLAEQDLTYKKAVELAQSLETALQNMKDLKTKKD